MYDTQDMLQVASIRYYQCKRKDGVLVDRWARAQYPDVRYIYSPEDNYTYELVEESATAQPPGRVLRGYEQLQYPHDDSRNPAWVPKWVDQG